MENHDHNTESVILEAAEAEFLEKGYGNAKVLSIAKRAGVSHSMLHYYFRSKERLFQMVFEGKVLKVSAMFVEIFNQNLPFEQTLKLFVETQFNFMAENPKVPYFMLTEILNNKENRDFLIKVLSEKVSTLANQLNYRLEQEINDGNIRQINFHDLLLNIASLNVFTFISMPILLDLLPPGGSMNEILDARRESNVQFILKSLRP